jgi:hypothetical protein
MRLTRLTRNFSQLSRNAMIPMFFSAAQKGVIESV